MSEVRAALASLWPPRRALLVAVAVLAASGVTSLLGNIVLHVRFADRPNPEDLLLDALPYVKVAEYATEVAIIGSLLLLLGYVLLHARDRIADVIAILGIMYLLRSFIMVLTPLASPNHSPGHFGITPLDQLGMFPSGHIAAALLTFMIIDTPRAPRMKRFALGLLIVQGGAMLLAHGHYAIDLVGGLLLGYFVYREWYDGRLFDPVKRLMGVPAGAPAGDAGGR